jgi:hypothetical protein
VNAEQGNAATIPPSRGSDGFVLWSQPSQSSADRFPWQMACTPWRASGPNGPSHLSHHLGAARPSIPGDASAFPIVFRPFFAEVGGLRQVEAALPVGCLRARDGHLQQPIPSGGFAAGGPSTRPAGASPAGVASRQGETL